MNPFYRLADLIAPDTCIVCSTEGSVLCVSCCEAELVPAITACYGCGKLTKNFQTCRTCIRNTPLLSVVVSVQYVGCARELVKHMKFHSKRGAVDVLSGMMSCDLTDIDIITYVPTDSRRVRERGFDHARILAHTIAAREKIPVVPLLLRTHNTHQVGSSRQKRLEQASNSYRSRNVLHTRGKRVLLIDDVLTTGATLSACAKILKTSGAKSVRGLVFAH